MPPPDAAATTAPNRSEAFGPLQIVAEVAYLHDVQFWEPQVRIERHDGGDWQPFHVPCGPECWRKDADAAMQVGWVTARQWLDGGRIPWKPRRLPAAGEGGVPVDPATSP